ncbi:hypothetical protein PVAP13_3NG140726 [Panicum virgatum]|uniref:Uncharacterized protein n=1 Tax=Panicum virgatum TaxID=38727 RepID=A0A8T0UAS7_PANVG|nr:hypothetical protein PVAP13_3NG140726 [Panicum virgatum]
MALAVSHCFGRGGGTSCAGQCLRQPRCTPDKCKQLCVSSGFTNILSTTCIKFPSSERCCCRYACRETPPVLAG